MSKGNHDLRNKTFEQATAELQEIVKKFEDGELALQDFLDKYELAQALIGHCQNILDKAELKITLADNKNQPSAANAEGDNENEVGDSKLAPNEDPSTEATSQFSASAEFGRRSTV